MSDAVISNLSASNPLDNGDGGRYTDLDNVTAEVDENTTEETRLGKIVYKKRNEFLNHVLRSLDVIVYLHLSVLYFLDCSLFSFLLSSLIQLWFFTPKPENIPPPRQKRSVLLTLFGVATFRIANHVLPQNPSTGEEMYGYLHGGLIIDFVGQKGPTSKLRLFAVDSILLLLQLIMLCLITTKEDIPTYSDVTNIIHTPQGLDEEERSERRRLYNPDGTPYERDTGTSTLAEENERLKIEMERRNCQITSGDFEVVKIDIINVVRRQWTSGQTLADGQNTDSPTASTEIMRRGRAWRFNFAEHTPNFG
ncbi:hypothetical protein EDC01DRAFT_649337 [Geopyxis carbonaria]|nr:hypothetical protein EDC01DRAFT_649337 [Geopyxis carbonaria]